MSHCGWGSCMESISMGVPIATWPMHSDQPWNAAFVTQSLFPKNSMAFENHVQPSIPRFDGHHYDHWSILMENFLWSKEYWTIVEVGVLEPVADCAILEIILNKSTSKNIWDSMKKKYQISEYVDDYFARTMAIANKMRIHGENLEDVAIVEKILRGESSNFAKHNEKNDESFLFMACHPKEVSKKNVWYMDTGCNNHMCKDKSAFSDLDESCQDKVKFGDNSTIAIKGRGKQKKMVNGLSHFDSPSEICEICMVSKQHRDSFPKDRSWRAKQTKSEALATFKNFKVLVENEVGRSIKVLRTDRGGEFNSKEFSDFCESNGFKRQLTTTYTPQQNGVCERRNRTIMNMVRSLMSKSSLPKEFWPEAVNWSVHILNRSPTSPLPDLMPEEAWSGRRPAIDYFRIFGCIAYAHVPDQKMSKLDDKGEKCIFLGVSDQSKAYRLYSPLTKKVIISRDVVFDEASTWSWTEKSRQKIPADFENGEDVTVQNSEGQTSADLEVSRQRAEESLPTGVEFNTGGSLPTTPELESGTSSRPQRKKRRPAWLEDYEVTDLPQDDVPVNHFPLFVDCDPLTYEEVVKEEKWQKAMNSWPIYQLDVKSAFLHGNLQEHVFIDQPPGYVKSGSEHKVYKLKKALYGLKQAPRAWYSRIDAYFLKEGFQKCPYEHTLYIKFGDGGKLIIVCLYVDDLIYTGNDFGMLEKFKQSMKLEFDMTNLGLLHYFLGLEVVQSDFGIFVFQKKYVQEVLDRFQMKNCNSVTTLVDKGVKLVKDPGGRFVDNKLYKQIVGSLMYLTATRLDIMHGVSLISRYMEHPKELHLQTAKRILRYLCGTTDFGLFYKKGDQTDLVGFTDSDYAGDLDDRKSTSGFVFMLGFGTISWYSKKQPIVTLSTIEVEYVAATSCACQAIWLRRVMEELELNQHEATSIYCDNSSAIKLSRNPVLHGRSKHIHVRIQFEGGSADFKLHICRYGVIQIGVVVREWSRRKELVTVLAIKEAIRTLMASEEGQMMRKRAKELGRAIRQAIEEGGVSRMELKSFINQITK
ncbi:hypothetical protein SLEP1_g3924 [Rubroshorea leprosula]|uniref:Integrase catalytic domain-containing protein n=1 Tax=Rubroshorea leprosula TaxID=152421 RepID=A0AAV5HV73_9ROSI|nr:hypothetical protein SLEP1_g3924 [Rubroshorea leprosula]